MTEKTKWMPILKEMTEKIWANVTQARMQKTQLPNPAFKELLDKQAQKAVIDTLVRYKVSAQLVSEEGDQVFGAGEYYVVADPVDGTTNLSRGLIPSVTSIAVSKTSTSKGLMAAIIMDLNSGETYTAERDMGAYLDGDPIETAPYKPFKDALTSIDMSRHLNLKKITRILETSSHMRQLGCSAMSLCHVASGVLDAHIDLRGIVRNTDVAAGLLILREAGGFYHGNGEINSEIPLNKEHRFNLIAASNQDLLDEIQDLVGN